MGGFFGVSSTQDCMSEVFFGVDYHSHLGTRRGGMAAYDKEIGLQRKIHNIENSPFRTKFEKVIEEMRGTSAIGCISDTDPQPMLLRSKFGSYAISTIGIINNAEELIEEYLSSGAAHFDAMTGGKVNSTELVGAMINQRDNFVDGIKYVQEKVKGTVSILILREDGALIAARDKLGRLPIIVGSNDEGHCVSFEAFVPDKLGYEIQKELGPGEIVEVTPGYIKQLAPPGEEMKICAFLWSYYGYPPTTYEGINVEAMRCRNGEIMAEHDGKIDIDYVCGVPDSGIPHAIGYSNKSGVPYARSFIKYTPTWARSFMPTTQKERNKIANKKILPVHDFIKDKKLLFVDDSIVRGTQLKETVDFLYSNGAKEVHMRSACPPIMYSCKYLNFSRGTSDMDLIARRVILELEGEEGFNHIEEYSDCETERGKNLRKKISEKFNFASLEFQSLEGIVQAIGLPKCKLCTYCWDGKE